MSSLSHGITGMHELVENMINKTVINLVYVMLSCLIRIYIGPPDPPIMFMAHRNEYKIIVFRPTQHQEWLWTTNVS